MAPTITQERPDTPDAIALIAELEAELAQHYPPASRHGLSVATLLAENVPFFVLRVDATPAACGGIKSVGTEYAELKRMYVRPQYRGRGYATLMLQHLETYARAGGIPRLRLETGIHQHAAIALYERAGFHRIPPFGPYTADPLSLCYEKPIDVPPRNSRT